MRTYVMSKLSALLAQVQTLTDDELIDWLIDLGQSGRLAELALIDRHFGIRDCRCKVEFIPCPRHARWFVWRDQGKTPRMIAYMHARLTGEKFTPQAVAQVVRRKRKSCDCPPVFAPCRHTASNDRFAMPLRAQIVLRNLLHPDEFTEPPPAPDLSIRTTQDTQIAVMCERAQAGYHPRRPDDLIACAHGVQHAVSRSRNGSHRTGDVIQR